MANTLYTKIQNRCDREQPGEDARENDTVNCGPRDSCDFPVPSRRSHPRVELPVRDPISKPAKVLGKIREEANVEDSDGEENIRESFLEGPRQPANISMKPNRANASSPPPPAQKPKDLVGQLSPRPGLKQFVIPLEFARKKQTRLVASDGRPSSRRRAQSPSPQRVGASDQGCTIF